jgi:hypothetical protein
MSRWTTTPAFFSHTDLVGGRVLALRISRDAAPTLAFTLTGTPSRQVALKVRDRDVADLGVFRVGLRAALKIVKNLKDLALLDQNKKLQEELALVVKDLQKDLEGRLDLGV